MNHPKTYLCLLVLCIGSTWALPGQSVRFRIYKGSKPIGSIQAQKERQGVKTTYTVTSEASFRIVSKFVRETFTKVVYEGKELESSENRETMNDNLKGHRLTHRKGPAYACSRNGGKSSFNLDGPLRYCASMLYFTEPKGQSHVFAESYQELCRIEEISPGIYKLHLPQGKINHYVYRSGKLEEIRVFRTMINLVFKREA